MNARNTYLVDFRAPDDLLTTVKQAIDNLPGTGFKTQYLKSTYLSKFCGVGTVSADVRRQRAVDKWLATETQNRETSVRLQHTPWGFQILPGVTFRTFTQWCRSFIQRTIGNTPPPHAIFGSFSGGASTSRTRIRSHPASKYVGKAHVTSAALPWFLRLQPEFPLWLGRDTPLRIEEYPGNVLFTVPKNSDIDRVACKEPDLNMFLQKGVGDVIRTRLRNVRRIDLNDQSINNRLARIGSIQDNLATLDISSASDSVTCEIVSHLLPPAWTALLFDLRSPVTLVGRELHENVMISSMGNGFTFELESLLFLTLTQAVSYFRGTRGAVSIYGDDIICPKDSAQYVAFVLDYFGFRVNHDKSFFEGAFRESCGGHYYNGLDVTPFYIRNEPKHLVDVIHLANSVRKWACIHDDVSVLDPEIESLWFYLKGLVPKCLWGGVDTSFKFQLASPDAPRMRLSELTQKRALALDGYLHWLSVTRDRGELSESIQTSRLLRETGKYRVRKSRPNMVDRMEHFFYSEIVQ